MRLAMAHALPSSFMGVSLRCCTDRLRVFATTSCKMIDVIVIKTDICRVKSRALVQRMSGIERPRLVIVTGARQTGKTTLARQQYPDLRYLNLDALEYRDLVREVSSFQWGRDVGPAILDEALMEASVFE